MISRHTVHRSTRLRRPSLRPTPQVNESSSAASQRRSRGLSSATGHDADLRKRSRCVAVAVGFELPSATTLPVASSSSQGPAELRSDDSDGLSTTSDDAGSPQYVTTGVTTPADCARCHERLAEHRLAQALKPARAPNKRSPVTLELAGSRVDGPGPHGRLPSMPTARKGLRASAKGRPLPADPQRSTTRRRLRPRRLPTSWPT
jgi:hypothetical protein